MLSASMGAVGLSLPRLMQLRSAAGASSAGPAKSCIVLFCWGGMSHLDTWDMKPEAPPEVRGQFQPIATATPGIHIGEHLPHLARQTERLAIVRSMHHGCSAHGKGMYWNLTGHAPPQPGVAANLPPSGDDWPSLGAVVSKFRQAPRGMPPAVRLPYPLVDNNTLQAGEYGGWLGKRFDPIVIRTPGGKPFGGVSRSLGAAELNLGEQIDEPRLQSRRQLLQSLDAPPAADQQAGQIDHFRSLAHDMLLSPDVRQAFELDREPERLKQAYGDHLCGRSMLLARRLTGAGVPLVTVACSAGDLNGSVGDHWDTHGDNFNRLKNTMLPTFDRPAAALLDDLADSGRLDETLVVILTEFGRTPRINPGAGRDHFPNCYSIALAGGGIRGGQVYGSSDGLGAAPRTAPCRPNDLHATIFRALGISLDAHLYDMLDRPMPITDGRPLPLV